MSDGATKPLDTDARILGLVLGLGDLQTAIPCHGYANACVCPECVERGRVRVREVRVAFPWEIDAA